MTRRLASGVPARTMQYAKFSARSARLVIKKLHAGLRSAVARAVAGFDVHDASGERAFSRRRSRNTPRHAQMQLQRLTHGNRLPGGKRNTAGGNIQRVYAMRFFAICLLHGRTETVNAQRNTHFKSRRATTLGRHEDLLQPASVPGWENVRGVGRWYKSLGERSRRNPVGKL